MTERYILPEDETFLINHIGPQLRRVHQASIKMRREAEIHNLTVDYGVLEPMFFSRGTVVLSTGWGSGWTGAALLGAEICKLGYKVVMPSMPGYGNSDNLPYWDKHDFIVEAEIFSKWLDIALPDEEVNLVGHSMGSIIQTEVAVTKKVLSLTLLDPVGFHDRNMLELALQFGINGFLHKRAFSGDPQQKIIEQFLPAQKSPFAKGRRKLRLSEAKRLCSNYALHSLRFAAGRIPIRCIYGTKDSVSKYVIDCDRILYQPLEGLYHNTTQYRCKETAVAIQNFLCELLVVD